jgi:hypothetical protein
MFPAQHLTGVDHLELCYTPSCKPFVVLAVLLPELVLERELLHDRAWQFNNYNSESDPPRNINPILVVSDAIR